MQLPLGDDCGGAVATLGPQLKLKKNVFQGVVVQVSDAAALPLVLARVRALSRLRRSQHFPHASRVRSQSPLHPSVLLQPEDDSTKRNYKLYRPKEDPAVAEDWEDDEELGGGDRLLHVLQRWQVENVLLVVARQDDSLSGRLIGQELFKLLVETAKLALEQYYLSRIKPSDVAKLEIFAAEDGKAQYLISPRVEHEELPPPSQQQSHRASVCVMNSATVATWPKDHQPTSDGGGRKATKQGRVNHFLHGRKTSSMPDVATAATLTPGKTLSTRFTESNQQNHPCPTETDALPACEGIDWLGISRDEWLKLRTIRVPIKELHCLFMCLIVLVDAPIEKQPTAKAAPTSRQNEQFNAPSYSWNRCRDVLQHTGRWGDKLKAFHGSELTKSQVTAIRAVLQEPAVNEAAFGRICSASVKIFAWIQRLVDEHDEHELGITSAAPPAAVATHAPRPPPKQPTKPTLQSFSVGAASAEESALVRELNALANAKKSKIVDHGRLISQRYLH